MEPCYFPNLFSPNPKLCLRQAINALSTAMLDPTPTERNVIMNESEIKSMSKSRKKLAYCLQPTCLAGRQAAYLPVLLMTIIFFLNHTAEINPTIRYVSKTGSSTPPYTTWETAADSIQKCINYSIDGDTIIVANGVYKESLVVNKYLWLWGSSMDSTVINGTGLANYTIDFQSDGYIQLFTIIGKGEGTILTTCILSNNTNAIISDCKILNALDGVTLVFSSSIVDRCIIINTDEGYVTSNVSSNYNPVIKNSIILMNNSSRRGILVDGGKNLASNNIVLGNLNSNKGIQSELFWVASTNIIKNNSVSGFNQNIDGYAADTAIVHNNISSSANQRGITINSKTDMRNNISAYNQTGVVGPTITNSDYNLYWQNNTHTTGGFAPNDIVADPMFVNDTIPVYGGTYDYRLQMFSPAIDAGDPNILDVDGTRSDIGAYGGPGGESYSYIDLPPRPPVNVSALVDSNIITLKWNRNTEADTSHYNVYRDTVANFIIDPTKLISSQTDTIFIQTLPQNVETLFYKITAVDNQENESLPSEELRIVFTTINDYPLTINDYMLYQNYPNPFNPSTKIGYKLKERGYVKLMVYDIKGELISVLVNEVKEAGYYEVNFEVKSQESKVKNELASGIYLYRIEVIGEGNIPRYSDMKKMILIK